MAALAGTQEEQTLAHEAEKVADHEVDLAFYDALRRVQETPVKLSPEAEITDRKSRPSKPSGRSGKHQALATQARGRARGSER
jgi:hypothetical protein